MALQHPAPVKSNSFKHEYTARYPNFRTPSPPTDAIEIFSPQQWPTHDLSSVDRVNSKKRRLEDHGNGLQDSLAAVHDDRPLSAHFDGHQHKRHYPSNPTFQNNNSKQLHNQVSPSPLDVFATVATSPSIGAAVPHKTHQHRSWITHSRHASESALNGESGLREHATKGDISRPREHEHSVGDSRPATSHYPISSRGSTHPSKPFETDVTTANLRNPPNGLGITNGTLGSSLEDAKLLLTLWEGSSNRLNVPFKDDPDGSTINTFTNDSSDNGFKSPHNFHHLSSSLQPGGIVSPQYVHGSPNCHHVDPSFSPNLTSVNKNNMGSRPSDKLVDQNVARNEASIASVAEKPKSRGWPKGKPRGPRNTLATGKKGTPKGRQKTSTSGSLQSTPQLSSDAAFSRPQRPFIPNENRQLHSTQRITPTQKKRRYSGTDLEDAIPRTIWADNISKRAASAGPVIQSMPVSVERPNPQHHSRQRKSRVNTCASCSSERNPMNGYQDFWINCNGCKNWFHHVCVGFKSEREVNNVDKFYCETCQPKHGVTTYVRKSSRAHTAVDYAGLNEGKIRSAHDVPDHHYIEPIKEGRIQLQPETFPRMRPELVTAEFFQKSGTMKEPVVIPGAWNPRPSQMWYDDETVDFDMDYEYDCVPDDGQDKLDMVIPEGLTVRRVSELYGPEEKLEVIDVKSQEGGDKRWNMTQWANYYEAEGEKPVRNVISLEVSASKLGKLIRRPKIVRDLDLQDAVWPEEEAAKGIFPRVQFYCLMSVADCYTDFHIDFGGSSVYYHILKGKKVFFFIPPRKQHLKKYEEWCLSSNQGSIFLGDETKECYRVDLAEGDTMLIPSGWIHAVWTPENSLVIGGNFLTRMHYGMQIQINDIEKSTGVARKFRYPHFQKIQWHAVLDYLANDPLPYKVAQSLWNGDIFERKQPVYYEFNRVDEGDTEPEYYNARHYSEGEIEGVQDLIRYCFRTVMISLGKVAGISKTTQEAVIRSLPKGYGDHFEIIQTFALWSAWKRGNEQIPSWAYPNAIPEDIESNVIDKKPMAPGAKRKGRPPKDPSKLAPERRSSRQLPKEQPPASGSAEQTEPVDESTIAETSVESKPSSMEEKKLTEDLKSTLDPFKRFGILPDSSSNLIVTEIAVVKEDDEISVLQSINVPGVSCDPVNDDDLTLANEEDHTSSVNETFNNQQLSSEDTSMPDAVAIAPSVTATPEQSSASKRPRTKACEDCKKSKRRCIHDENGQIDPLKAQESPVRRGAQNSKRARNNSDAGADGPKRFRRASNSSLKPQTEIELTQFQPKISPEARAIHPSSAEPMVQSFIQNVCEEQPNHLPTPQSNDDSVQAMTDASRSAGPSPPQGPTKVESREVFPTDQITSNPEHSVGDLNNGSRIDASVYTHLPTANLSPKLINESLSANSASKSELSPTLRFKSSSFKQTEDQKAQDLVRQVLPSLRISPDMKSSTCIKKDDDGLVSPPLSPPISPFTDAAPSSPVLGNADMTQLTKIEPIKLPTEHETNKHNEAYHSIEAAEDDSNSSSIDESLFKSHRTSEISQNKSYNISKQMESTSIHLDLSHHNFEDEDMEFARSLAEQDFGLRRRKHHND